MDRVVHNPLQQNQLIYEYQSGFLPLCSTVYQFIEIYNSIVNSLEKDANCFVFCDFSKAFDKICHRGLLHKIEAYETTENLLINYLHQRR